MSLIFDDQTGKFVGLIVTKISGLDHNAYRIQKSSFYLGTINIIVDERNLYSPEQMVKKGITYYAIGRGCQAPVQRLSGPVSVSIL